MKIVYCKHIPFSGYICMMICGLLIVRKEYKSSLNERIINHERIHFEQQKEMLFLGFFLWYAVEWLIRLLLYFDAKKAYRNLLFEKEARKYEGDLEYIKNREPFNFMDL